MGEFVARNMYQSCIYSQKCSWIWASLSPETCTKAVYTVKKCSWRWASLSPETCTKAVYTVKKCSWRWASLSPETCRADSNTSVIRSINENCYIWLVAYIIALMMHGLTNLNVSLRIRGLFNDPVSQSSCKHSKNPVMRNNDWKRTEGSGRDPSFLKVWVKPLLIYVSIRGIP